MSDEIECKIISMFGLGMSYLDIAGHISEIYGLDVSNATISAVTDKLILKSSSGSSGPWTAITRLFGLMLFTTRLSKTGATQPKRFTRFWGLILRAGRKFLACIYLKPKVQTSGSRC